MRCCINKTVWISSDPFELFFVFKSGLKAQSICEIESLRFTAE